MDEFPRVYIHDTPETALVLAKSSFGIKRGYVTDKLTFWVQGLGTGQVAYGIDGLTEVSESSEIVKILGEVLHFTLTQQQEV